MDPKFLRNQKYAKKNNKAPAAHPKNRAKGTYESHARAVKAL